MNVDEIRISRVFDLSPPLQSFQVSLWWRYEYFLEPHIMAIFNYFLEFYTAFHDISFQIALTKCDLKSITRLSKVQIISHFSLCCSQHHCHG